MNINRATNGIVDEVQIPLDQHWYNTLQVPAEQKNIVCVKLIASARKHLKAPDPVASLSGGSDGEWTRYRDSQQVILNSLQETHRSLLFEFSRKSLELEASANERLQQSESKLREHYNALEENLVKQNTTEKDRLAAREKEIEEREKKFNTKEARYVARNEQQKQIDQIKQWLEGWSLTKGTRSKRTWVLVAYVAGAIFTGSLTWWYSSQTMEIISSSNGQLPWWQWVLLAIKAIFPLAAFITILIAFIRWSAEWAKQHADEEFRNRARVLDIGRTAWLLEAVRDAQDSGKELPVDLLKELSRNLFVYSSTGDGIDLHPQAVSDVMMQGLSSFRLKTPDGSEVEAKRGKV